MTEGTTWSRKLVQYRNRSGLSRSELAERSGLSYPYVSQLETGLRKPSRKAAVQLADALGIDPLELERSLQEEYSDRSLRSVEPLIGSAEAPVSALRARSFDAGRPPRSDREDLIGQLVDLVEEADPDERIDLLADLQREVLRRLR